MEFDDTSKCFKGTCIERAFGRIHGGCVFLEAIARLYPRVVQCNLEMPMLSQLERDVAR